MSIAPISRSQRRFEFPYIIQCKSCALYRKYTKIQLPITPLILGVLTSNKNCYYQHSLRYNSKARNGRRHVTGSVNHHDLEVKIDDFDDFDDAPVTLTFK